MARRVLRGERDLVNARAEERVARGIHIAASSACHGGLIILMSLTIVPTWIGSSEGRQLAVSIVSGRCRSWRCRNILPFGFSSAEER